MYYDFAEKQWQKKPFKNKLIVLSAEKRESIEVPLFLKLPIKVNLERLSVDEITLALNQRVSLLKLKLSSQELLSKIAQSCETVGQAMEVLTVSYRASRAKDKETITESHINKALYLLGAKKKTSKAGG